MSPGRLMIAPAAADCNRLLARGRDHQVINDHDNPGIGATKCPPCWHTRNVQPEFDVLGHPGRRLALADATAGANMDLSAAGSKLDQVEGVDQTNVTSVNGMRSMATPTG